MRILNVGDFNWMTGRERDTANVDLFAIRSKLTNAAVRANHQVVEFSDRAVARTATPLRSRRLGRPAANRAFLRLVDEVRPDLIFLNFADDLDNASLDEARRLAVGVTIVDVNIDPLPDAKNQARLLMRRSAVDALFVTTAGPALRPFSPTRGFAAHMPNPVDPAIESGRAFAVPHEETTSDLILPAGDDSARRIGNQAWRPSVAVSHLRVSLPRLRISAPGLETPRLRGAAYFDALGRARFGWALSRYNDQPLYASDRMAHMFASGLLTAIDAKPGFDRYYTPDEALFYQGVDDLVQRLDELAQDPDLSRNIAHLGWRKSLALFDVGRVFSYVVDQLFRDGGAGEREWPADRWQAGGRTD